MRGCTHPRFVPGVFVIFTVEYGLYFYWCLLFTLHARRIGRMCIPHRVVSLHFAGFWHALISSIVSQITYVSRLTCWCMSISSQFNPSPSNVLAAKSEDNWNEVWLTNREILFPSTPDLVWTTFYFWTLYLQNFWNITAWVFEKLLALVIFAILQYFSICCFCFDVCYL